MTKKNQKKRPEVHKQILLSILVIALSAVIAVRASSMPSDQTSSQVQDDTSKVASALEPKGADLKSSVEAAKAESKEESKLTPKVDGSTAAFSPSATEAEKAAAKEADSASKAADSEAGKRKARFEAAPEKAAGAASDASKQEAAKAVDKKAESKLEPKTGAASAAAATAAAKPAKQLAKSASKGKLPANLGTVTSTGSGGHSYMSKHDAYSAIAEKHGALAQDAMKKTDKRQIQSSGFGSIQKASGIGDMLSPFKGVTDSGLARTLGASMRSIMKSKFSVPAYVASALLGAVALMAFYESPISPLPVPPLPEPPVGRFPPEMPNLPVGTQVPFRGNQQQGGQNYNQRTMNQYNGGSSGYLGQQAQQVLFPGNNNAQQRQMTNGPVQQLTSNILSTVGKPTQIAQRKSSPDYDLSSSRSFFGSLPVASPKQSVAASSNQQKQGNSFLSYFGFGNNSPSTATSAQNGLDGLQSNAVSSMQMAGSSGLSQQNAANLPFSSSVESKGAASGQTGPLSNSHLVNKVKSLFNRSPNGPSSGGAHTSASVSNAAANPYEQYQRMSVLQALMKDTAFIPGFLSPTRKSSPGSGSQSGANKISQTLSNALSGSPNPSARMQVDSQLAGSMQLPASSKQAKPTGSNAGYGLVHRAADRIAHALFETFTSSVSQRQASSGLHDSNQLGERKSSSNDDASSSLAAATSLLGDIVSSYSAANAEQSQQQQQLHEKSASQSSPSTGSQSTNQQSTNNQQASVEQASARSADLPASKNVDEQQHEQQQQQSKSQQSNSGPLSNKQQSQAAPPASSQEAHVRKTRSIGLEYPIESNQELVRRDQQSSKATQINNVIDFVADSYSQNRLLFNFVMNQVGLSHAVPYVEQILAPGANEHH